MKLTVLGNNGPFPGAGGACSGYLIEEGATRLLVDCGSGVLANLQKLMGIEMLDAVILTHLHSDHFADMLVLRYAVQIKRKRGQMDKYVRVYAPSEPASERLGLEAKDAFELGTIDEATVLAFNGLKVSFREMRHPVKTFAVAFENGTKRFVFSGDTSWTESIIDFCRGADVAMLDAGLLSKDKTDDDVPHLTAAECGTVAARAGVKKLLLTHFWPEYDRKQLLSEAKQGFDKVELTELMKSYEI